jgi:hypothetical protein
MRARWVSLAVVSLAGGAARAQELAVAFRNGVNIGASAVDQFGQTFAVTGLSGIVHAGGETYWAVMDNSDRLVRLRVVLTGDGAIASAAITGGLRLAQSRDHEDLVLTAWGTALVCEENGPGIHEYSMTDGSLVRSLVVPGVFATRRANFGFEAMTIAHDGSSLWVANEEALTVDGGVSTPGAGTRVRLQCFDVTAASATAGVQVGYLTAPMHAGAISGGRSGVSAMVMLPSGRLLTMERSFANNFLRFFETRVYETTVTGATETSGLTSLLDASTLAGKRLLYSGGQTNLEGLCVGPGLAGGGFTMIGVVDDGDPISVNRVVSMVVTGPVGVPCGADFNGDGFLDFFDYDAFVGCYEGMGCPAGRADADFNGDGFADFFDYDAFVAAYETGC